MTGSAPASVSVPVIDANMHWLPETLFSDPALLQVFLDAPPRAYGIEASLRTIGAGPLREIVIEQPRGYPVLDYGEGQYAQEGQLADMDRAGIGRAVLRLPCWQEWLDLDGCRRVNDGLAAHVARAPDRFSALAVVPPWGTSAMLAEAERRLAQPGFVGVQLAAHYGQLYLDDAAFRPLLRFCAANRVPVVVHHTPLPADYTAILPYANQRRQFGRCMAQATAIGRELFSGLFDDLPDLRLSHSMLGGAFFAFVDMLFPPANERYGDEVDRFDASARRLRAQLGSNIVFDISGAPQWGAAQLECAVKVLGAGAIMYGGSYPIRRDWFFDGPATIAALAIAEADKAAIMGGTAQGFFGL